MHTESCIIVLTRDIGFGVDYLVPSRRIRMVDSVLSNTDTVLLGTVSLVSYGIFALLLTDAGNDALFLPQIVLFLFLLFDPDTGF